MADLCRGCHTCTKECAGYGTIVLDFWGVVNSLAGQKILGCARLGVQVGAAKKDSCAISSISAIFLSRVPVAARRGRAEGEAAGGDEKRRKRLVLRFGHMQAQAHTVSGAYSFRHMQAQTFAGSDICRLRHIQFQTFAGSDRYRFGQIQVQTHAGLDTCRLRRMQAQTHAGSDIYRQGSANAGYRRPDLVCERHCAHPQPER